MWCWLSQIVLSTCSGSGTMIFSASNNESGRGLSLDLRLLLQDKDCKESEQMSSKLVGEVYSNVNQLIITLMNWDLFPKLCRELHVYNLFCLFTIKF